MTKMDSLGRLQQAVITYVEEHAGKVVIIGDIEVQRWPEDREHVFRIALKCTGKAPAKMSKAIKK